MGQSRLIPYSGVAIRAIRTERGLADGILRARGARSLAVPAGARSRLGPGHCGAEPQRGLRVWPTQRAPSIAPSVVLAMPKRRKYLQRGAEF